MSYPEINTLTSPLSCLPINKPIISYSTYIRNKHKDLDCNYWRNWRKYLFDGYIEFDPQYFYGISNHHKSNNNLSSVILSRITNITNKYFADKRMYISGITPQSYYYLSRGYGKSIRELCYFIKLILDSEKSRYLYNPYSLEYTVQNYKSDMENLYKKIISEKILNSYETQNNSTKQRSNNKEEMSCLQIIAGKNNTNKKFHK
nr:MAG TPA: hypothetical protein [Caudoviricetes sp.]